MHRIISARAVLALAAALLVACAGNPGITGQWLMGSQDSVAVVMEFLSTGEMRVHQYYLGHDPTRRDSVRHEDSLIQAGGAAANMRWSIHGDTLCMLSANEDAAFDHRCAPYRIRSGNVPVLQIEGGSPWSRYQGQLK
jgi:hypothetical protein